MLFIRQNATHKVVLGPFVDVGDGFTPETGITLSGADEAEAILHDNGTVVDISGYTWAAITTADGYYHLTLQAGISGTIGHLTIVVQDDSVCLPVKADFTVLEEATYDSIFASAAGSLATEAKQDTIDTVVDAIKLETDKLTLGDAGAGVAGSIIEEIENRATPAQVQTELGTYDGPTKAEMDTAVGTQADAAAAGDPSSAESVMQYVKQIVNILVGTAGVTTFPAEAAPANAVSLAEVIRAIHTDVTGLNGDAMRGTDNAALASVLGALTDAAAAGDPTTADTIMQYVKQLINILIGTAGIATWPAATAPGNAVSIAEALRAVYDDTDVIGAAGAGLTEAGGTGDHLTAVPWNASWDAEVQSEVADALDAAIPGSPTADSINEVLAWLRRSVKVIQEYTIDNTSFTATTTQAQVDAVDIGSLEATDDHFNGRIIIFTSGALIYQATDITDYDGANKRFTYTALTEAPADNDTFIII